MKRRILALTLACVFILLALTSCFQKTAVTEAEFSAAATEAGLEVRDTLEMYEERTKEQIRSSTSAYAEDEKWTCHFVTFYEESYAVSAYQQIKAELESRVSGAWSSSYANMVNYNKYEINSNELFMYVCRVDDTVFYMGIEKEYKAAAKDIIAKIGY